MTETQFIEQNKAQWKELESLLRKKDKDPDKLHDLFVKVSSDLAYASTFYPKRSVRAYLNQLTQQVFDSMEEKKNEFSLDGIRTFFGHTLPIEMYRCRKQLLAAFLIFVVAVLIGVISSANNPAFVNIILGDSYVSMTENNINDGDPMRVYKEMEQSDMFFMITVNNVRVSFFCFMFGLFGGIGTAIFLLYNGIMVGAFQYFFYAKGLFMESFLTIWIHGTIEMSAIIIAGAAGIVLGNGIIFPRTYSRAASLQISAKRAIRILLGTTPLFIIAGFLESFITRLTDMPVVVKVLIIGLSLLFILGLYVIHPMYYHHRVATGEEEDLLPSNAEPLQYQQDQHRSLSGNMSLALSQFRAYFGLFASHALLPMSGILLVSMLIYQLGIREVADYESLTTTLTSTTDGGGLMFVAFWMTVSYAVLIISMIYRSEYLTIANKMAHIKYYLPVILSITLIPIAIWFFLSSWWLLGLFVIAPPQIFFKMAHDATEIGWRVWTRITHYFSDSYRSWVPHVTAVCFVLFFQYLLSSLLGSDLMTLIWDFIYWHEVLPGQFVVIVLVTTLMNYMAFLFVLPVYFYSQQNIWHSESAKVHSTDLWNRYADFHGQSPIFESRR